MICEKCSGHKTKKIEIYKFFDIYECELCSNRKSVQINTCCRAPFEIIVHWQNTNGIYYQCYNCGGCQNIKKPLPHVEYGNKVRGEFNEHLYYDWKTEIQNEKNDFFHTNRAFSKRGFWTFYNNHLNSKYWKEIRLETLERDKYICQNCKSNKATDVHHLSYKRLGNESLFDLISYCRPCHEKIHGRSF